MLLREKMENCTFSNSERVVLNYILDKGTHIQNMTIKEISEETFTVPSTLIRIAKKLNYDGWNSLKEDFLKECEYLEQYFVDIDANLPFKNNDTIMSIAGKIAALEKESIEDTLSLITHDDLQKAIQIMRKASCIHLFAVSNNLLITQEFKHNMSRIQKDVRIHGLQNEITFDAILAQSDSCAIIVSYSGETYVLDKVANTLKNKNIPLIVITSIGDNTLSRKADCTLRICTREKLYSKIATFSTDRAITYLLDVLYSCMFALDYVYNLNLKIQTSKAIENGRFSTLDILKED